jgi:hypothetical protein
LEGFLKEVLMDNNFNANSGHINVSEFVDKSLEAYQVLTYMNSYEAWKEECIKEMLLAAQSAPQLIQGPAAKKIGRQKVQAVVSIKGGPRQGLTHTMHWWM